MKYAIIESGGKQYRAVEGGTIEVDRLPNEIGANVKLEQILLIADGDNVSVGVPLLQDMPVWTTVLEHFKGKKVTTFNYSPKKRIRVKSGHRQSYTRLLVEQIGGSEFKKKEPAKKAKKAAAEVEAAPAMEETPAVTEPVKKPAAKKTAAPKSTKASTTAAKKTPSKAKAEPKKTTSKASSKKPAKKE